MSQGIGVVGLPLVSQPLYPPGLAQNLTSLAYQNRVSLPPGGDIIIPPGQWMINVLFNSQLQMLDPVTQTWVPYCPQPGANIQAVESDGVNYRVMNPTGFPIGAVVNASGSGFTSAPAIAAANPTGSLWTAVIGGGIASLSCPSTVANASGVGYSVPPILCIAPPPSPGVQATAVCAISGGAISNFTVINPGAGYPSGSPPVVIAIPQQSDVNFGVGSTTNTTNATVTANISYAGNITAVLLTNEGSQPASLPPALSFSGGGGSGAAATAILAQVVTAVTVTSGGTGFPAAGAILSAGGSIYTQTSGQGTISINPSVTNNLLAVPRPFVATSVQGSSTGVQVGQIIDNGLFTAPPLLYSVPNGTGFFATPVMGSINDTVFLQKVSG